MAVARYGRTHIQKIHQNTEFDPSNLFQLCSFDLSVIYPLTCDTMFEFEDQQRLMLIDIYCGHTDIGFARGRSCETT